jgi:glycine dehydrogenase
VQRNVLEDPGWYTPYTPYQAEIAQGRLEQLVNFQTAIADLTGLPVANASLLDEATAAAEAVGMAVNAWGRSAAGRASGGAAPCVVLSSGVLPQTTGVVRTRTNGTGVEVILAAPGPASTVADAVEKHAGKCALALFQCPAVDGSIEDLRDAISRCKAAGALVAIAADPLALALMTPPGELGADIALGNTQRFGVPMGYGGPHAAYFATSNNFVRNLPGRIMGVSRDRRGSKAYRMTLQTREQHIRRERATSNICTAQALLANVAAFYLIHHGPDGLRQIASDVHTRAQRFAGAIAAGAAGPSAGLAHDSAFFDAVAVRITGLSAPEIAARLSAEHGVNVGVVGKDALRFAFDETHTDADVDAALAALANTLLSLSASSTTTTTTTTTGSSAGASLPTLGDVSMARTSEYLTHPVFNMYHSETRLMRYMRHLQTRDYSLADGIVPLGSCTMKLNAAAEMAPISWPEAGAIHPFCPADQALGYGELLRGLEADLAELTGFSRVSFQPNAGSQGEYAGLLAIRSFHEARGDADRRVCLIPRSAHGTNPASAVMAGMKVVTIEDDADGCVSMADLEAKLAEHGPRVAALMVTFPTTFGVFVPILEITKAVHDVGGLVYLDGANFNALAGVARPGDLGADVCHLNLHKTFAIPHGGGGPGMGPIGVSAALAPYLPSHPVVDLALPESYGPVSAAPYSSASILLITAMYLRLLGGRGVRESSETAMLSANYMAEVLGARGYKVAYVNAGGRCAHEFILDVRKFKQSAGVTATDIAKRLQDYGLHAPTMNWPLPDSLMIEPTESESLAELDRLIDALTGIRAEIARVESGEWPRDDNPLVNAPHPLAEVAASEWTHPYTREEAAFPAGPGQSARKFWPSVARCDEVFGDKNLRTVRAPEDVPPV